MGPGWEIGSDQREKERAVSQYEARCATNRFRVRSVQELRDALETEGFMVVTDAEKFSRNSDMILMDVSDEGVNEVALFAGGEYGMWPDLYDYETEEEKGGLGGVTEAVSLALCDDSVAVFTEVGAEKWDLNGYSVAVSASGEVVEVSLRDIIEIAQRTFVGTTVKP